MRGEEKERGGERRQEEGDEAFVQKTTVQSTTGWPFW